MCNHWNHSLSRQTQLGWMIHKKTSVNFYLTYFFEFFLTKLADSFFITWNVLGLSVRKKIYANILPVVKQPSSMLSSTTWRLTLKRTNHFQTCLFFFSRKTETYFFCCVCVLLRCSTALWLTALPSGASLWLFNLTFLPLFLQSSSVLLFYCCTVLHM